MKLFSKAGILVLMILTGMACGSRKKSKPKTQIVPIAINIQADDDHPLQTVNLDIYRFKLIQDIRQFQRVDLELVEADENPEVVFDLNIDHMTVWPRDERNYRRVFSRTVAVGMDAKGKPIYQTVTATVDFTFTTIRSNARFMTKLTFKGSAPDVFQRVFVPRYNFSQTQVANINGDPRAVDPSIVSSGSLQMEPTADDFLLMLSQQEMVRRISDEIRKRYP